MNTQYLREFLHLSKTLNYFETANDLYISASTLSKHIKTLEKDLRVELFIRTTRKVRLSSFGTLLVPVAQAIIDQENSFLSTIHKSNELVIASNFKIADILSHFIKAQGEKNSVKIQKQDLSEKEIVDLLLSKKIDFGFLMNPVSEFHEQLSYVCYEKQKLMAVANLKSEIADMRVLTFEQMLKYPYISLEGENKLKDKIGIDFALLHSVLTVNTGRQALDYIRENIGFTLLPYESVKHSLNSELCVIDIFPPVYIPVYYVFNKKKNMTTLQKEFLTTLETISKC